MDFSDSQYTQLIVALGGGFVLFALVYSLSEKVSLGFLMLLVPFQVIDSSYGTLNTVLIYLVAGAYLLQGRLTKLPFIGPIVFILFAFLLAFSQAPPEARVYHILYLVGFFANVLLFYLVYNFVLRTKDWRFVFKILIVLNIFFVIYCAIQFWSGREPFYFFGIQEFAMNPIRRDGRLMGPFNATAATADYLTLQVFFLAYILIRTPPRRIRVLVVSLLVANFLFLISTGNRGGFISLIIGGLLFLFVFRRELGFARIAKLSFAGGMLFTIVAVGVVSFTQYGMLFDRLEGTTVEGGVPDTRARAWPDSWGRIQDQPVLGHGPRLRLTTLDRAVGDIPYVIYPHNLVLHILYTTGIVGLVAWIIFFWSMTGRLLMVKSPTCDDQELAGLPRLGLVIIGTLMVSQIRIEFLREGLLDLQNYLFVLFALFLSSRDLIVEQARGSTVSRGFGKPLGSGKLVRRDVS
jgi:O-antigen ligase